LLAWLDGGVDSGGEGYLDMRRRLSAYFDRRSCRVPDDLADETLNRVSRRLEEEGTLEGPPGRYCYIVAKFVFLEYLRRASREDGVTDPREAASLWGDARAAVANDSEGTEKRLSCLDRCLDQQSSGDRELILDYYVKGPQPHAERRRDLAARLGLTANALAIRACRIRDRLEGCVRSCEGEG